MPRVVRHKQQVAAAPQHVADEGIDVAIVAEQQNGVRVLAGLDTHCLLRLDGLARRWQIHGEPCPATVVPDRTLDNDVTAVLLYGAVDDCEAEAGAARARVL